MKTKIGRRAKSALSILLTLCMILSVFTVGIASASAATADSEEVGASDLGTVWFDNSVTKWSNVYCFVGKSGYVRAYKMDAITGNSTIFTKNIGGFTDRTAMFFASAASITMTDGTTSYSITTAKSTLTSGSYTANITAGSDDGSLFYVKSATNGSTLYRQTDKYVIASGTSGSYSGLSNSNWSNTADVMNYNGTNYSITYENVAAGSYAVAMVKYNDWNTKRVSKGTGTNCTLGSYDGNLTITTTSLSDITISSTTTGATVNVTATAKKIAAPTNVKINSTTASSVNADSSTNSTLSWTAVSGAASYKIFKDGTQVGTSTTNSYSISNNVANAGSYTVKAVPSDSGYLESDASAAATLTVYEPMYCISGNHVDWGAYLIDYDNDGVYDDDPKALELITAPDGTASYFNTWQEVLAIDNPTATPGKYSFTFKTKEKANYDWNGFNGISLCLYQKNTAQRAFVLNGEVYNTSAHGDITVSDAGITDEDNLFAYNLAASTPGGSLKLKRGQTYTITIDQTQRYQNSSSNPWGKITITANDVFADVAAKKQAFNATDRQYDNAVDCETAIGIASAKPEHHASSLTTVLTAEVANANYEFIGWFNTPACTGDPAIAASTCTKTGDIYTKSVTINTTTEYYALFKQKTPAQYTVTLTQPSYGVISTTGGVSGSNAYQGATVSLNATVTDNSKEFSHWVITSGASGSDITGTVCANPTQATTTFTMPAQNVTVTAIYSNKTAVNITTSSNNTALGTASYTAGTYYYVGDDIPITATNVGGVFSRWVVTGGTVANANSAATTIKATGATVTARAVFDYKTYELYVGGKKLPMIRQDDGSYVSTSKVDSSGGQFTVYDASEKKYAISEANPYGLHTNSSTPWPSGPVSSWESADGYKYAITNEDVGSYYVKYTPPATSGNGSVSIISSYPNATIAQIYAKDGSIRYRDGDKASPTSSDLLWDDPDWAHPDTETDHRGKMTCLKGTTVITAINSTSVTDADSKRYAGTYKNGSSTVNTPEHLKIYSAPIGSTITIKTTVNDTYKEQGFYVGMFVVNGWKVAATDAGKGVYTATYTLTDETAVNNLATLGGQKSFEITPVYYNKNFEYITFYVDADSVPSEWGNTISTCTDYNGAYYPHFEGSYPGQPLGREGDLYEIKVAKYYYDYNSSTGVWTRHVNYHPSATITAYNYDSVHHYYYVYADELVNANTNKNLQTYDYSDFAYLAQIDKIEAILFRCKKETSHSSWQIYNKADNTTGDNDANYNATTPNWYFVDNKLSNFNTWQVLTDYYGNPIDALGNRVHKSGSTTEYYTAEDVKNLSPTQNSTNQIRIVSYGNRKTDDDSANARTSAKWATGWAVYSGGSTAGSDYRIAYGTPADFISTTPGTASTSNVHYLDNQNASALTDKLTFITYDKERTNKIGGIGDTGQRIDGQWYYSAQHDFDSTVQVHITSDEGTAVTKANTSVDADSSASGTNDGWDGTTSKTTATLDGETTHTYSNVTTEAALNCTLGSGYTFVGWYIYDGTNYTKIHDNFADQNTTMTMKKNYTIVAVVRAVGAGDLVITHSRYTGSNPNAHDGTGKYYVSAVVKHNNGTTTPYAEAQNSLTIPQLKATDKLTITIHTVCNGADTFYAWYEEALGENYSRTGNYYEICSEDVDPLGETDVSYTFFEADCSTFFDGSTLKRNTIDLYSDIVHVSAYATLTYKYYDRFEENGKNQMVSYVVRNVPLDDDEITNGYIPSDEKITKYAPNVVDTIYTDTKWTIVGTKVERAASNVTLMATQSAKDCFVQYLPYDTVAGNLLNGDTETPVTEVAAWNTKRVPFNSWMIDDNADVDNWDPSDFYVTAPETYTKDNITWRFVRFDVYAFDRMDSSGNGVQNKVIYSTNDNIFGYRIYADCVIYPVYTKETASTALAAKAEPAVLNREVYGESTNLVDKLYADLLISYINVAAAANQEIPEVIRDNTEPSYTIETGVILDKSVDLTTKDYNTLKHAGEARDTDTTQSIISSYSGFVPEATVESFAKTATAEPGKSVTGTGDAAKLTKYVNKNADLTNKNRLDKVFRYDNKESIQKRVTAAYSYIIIKRNNEIVGFAISDAQLFNFAYLGNKPLEKVAQ